MHQIQYDDSVLLNIYRDYLLQQKDLRKSDIREKSEELRQTLIDFIKIHLSILEDQVSNEDDTQRFQYVTERIIFWKNVLLHQLGTFYHSRSIKAPDLLELFSETKPDSHNNGLE